MIDASALLEKSNYEELGGEDIAPVKGLGGGHRRASMEHTGHNHDDLPIGDAFFCRRNFYLNLVASVIIGLVVGPLSFIFFNVVERSQSIWSGANNETLSWYDGYPGGAIITVNGTMTQPYASGSGRVIWLAFMGGGGLLLGVFKVLSSFPQGETKTFFEEITSIHMDPRHAALTAFGGWISLCAGASVGPEAPVAALGGGFAAWLAECFLQPKANVEIWTLCGMAAAMGSLFASPVLSVLLLIELSTFHQSRYMEMTVLMFVSACISFVIYQSLANTGQYFIQPVIGPKQTASLMIGYDVKMYAEAIPLGILSGVVGIVVLMTQAVAQRAVLMLQTVLRCGSPKSKVSMLVTPLIGGLLLGAIGIYQPLTIGDGAVPLELIVGDGYQTYWNRQLNIYQNDPTKLPGELGELATLIEKESKGAHPFNNTKIAKMIFKIEGLKHVVDMQKNKAPIEGWPNPAPTDRKLTVNALCLIALFKAFAFAISGATGFIGGIMFPFFFVGACVGNIVSQLTGINQTFACITMMIAVPTAFSPCPMTFLWLIVALFLCSAYQTGAIFVAMIVAYCTVCGSGVILKLTKTPLPPWELLQPSIREALDLGRRKVDPASLPDGKRTVEELERLFHESEDNRRALLDTIQELKKQI